MYLLVGKLHLFHDLKLHGGININLLFRTTFTSLVSLTFYHFYQISRILLGLGLVSYSFWIHCNSIPTCYISNLRWNRDTEIEREDLACIPRGSFFKQHYWIEQNFQEIKIWSSTFYLYSWSSPSLNTSAIYYVCAPQRSITLNVQIKPNSFHLREKKLKMTGIGRLIYDWNSGKLVPQ